MNAYYDRTLPSPGFRNGARDLATFFRSLASPRLRRATSETRDPPLPPFVERAKYSGQQPLEFFDADLHGREGAAVVLRELERNPGTRTITLSQNCLGDDGVRELAVGIKRLRAKGVGARLKELNLSGNHLGDTAFHLITLHLLQPAPHPPTITHLYVTGNDLSLGSLTKSTSLTTFLGTAFSSPTSSLTCLSLTNNRQIGHHGVVSLLRNLRLSNGSSLAQLHLSLCGLTPDCATPLADWLSDPEGGGQNLQVLALNGNYLSTPGLQKLTRALSSGQCSGLVELECFANEEDIGPEFADIVKQLEDEEAVQVELERKAAPSGEAEGYRPPFWRDTLDAAKERNRGALKETRQAALQLLAPLRVLFCGNPQEAEGPGGELAFPFLQLPIELQVHVMRCALFSYPSTKNHLFPPLSPFPALQPSSDSSVDTLYSPLTEHQFLRLLSHGAERKTLEVEAQLARGFVPHLVGRDAMVGSAGESKDGGGEGEWEDWVLKVTRCARYERT